MFDRSGAEDLENVAPDPQRRTPHDPTGNAPVFVLFAHGSYSVREANVKATVKTVPVVRLDVECGHSQKTCSFGEHIST